MHNYHINTGQFVYNVNTLSLNSLNDKLLYTKTLQVQSINLYDCDNMSRLGNWQFLTANITLRNVDLSVETICTSTRLTLPLFEGLPVCSACCWMFCSLRNVLCVVYLRWGKQTCISIQYTIVIYLSEVISRWMRTRMDRRHRQVKPEIDSILTLAISCPGACLWNKPWA